ncbi:FAD binding domain-containing protein [Halogeometricum limi]|uniref:2-polyprenyl-6-methoxyphenol hydroxylase n=1 Tax=Halogeometricum limi TaxID=555875 RepID=A0A1I6IBT1_9EURY|nr:FAD-dependent monooxygenase [Halogeometricum limi]SFR64212.1 2-polyprenyl-6-methoxyphenol hydroxylase [Halogeometricum limi]
MATRVYDYPGEPKVDYDDHVYYGADVMRDSYRLPPLHGGDDERVGADDRLDILVSGGSMGGLFTALALYQAGHDVHVFERTARGKMKDRGAGIIAHPEMLAYLEREGVSPQEQVSITTDRSQYLDSDGAVVYELDSEILTTSWDTVYRSLRDALPDWRYHMGKRVVDVTQDSSGVDLTFEDGDTAAGDLLVVAEGYRSTTRDQYLPDTAPEYAGYVAWRGVVDESELTAAQADLSEQFGDIYSFYHAEDFQILTYPVPGPNGEVEPGRRRINWVWYYNVEPDELNEVLTDRSGERRRFSLPPGSMRESVRAHQVAVAEARLPPQFARLVAATERPFVQNIYDLSVPQLVFDRVCLLGDAAFFIRPHMAAGTAHAAADALALGEALSDYDSLESALSGWEESQLELGHEMVEKAKRRGEIYTGRR